MNRLTGVMGSSGYEYFTLLKRCSLNLHRSAKYSTKSTYAAITNYNGRLVNLTTRPIINVSNSSFSPIHPNLIPLSSDIRKFSTLKSTNISITDTTEEEFDHHIHHTFDIIQERLEQSDCEDENVDINYIDGVLKIVIPDIGIWILSRHSATKQLWLSSPISGPSKYNFHRSASDKGPTSSSNAGHWKNERDESILLHNLLKKEFTTSIGFEVIFSETF
jgi:frataxin-like iron-binding protein CyaY